MLRSVTLWLSHRSCHLGNVNPYINFVSSSKGLYAGLPFRSMSKDLAARWRALPASEREPFIVQARRSQAEIAKAEAKRLVVRLPHRRHTPSEFVCRKCHRRAPIGTQTHIFRVAPPGQLCAKCRPAKNYRSYWKLFLLIIVYICLAILLVVGSAIFFFWVPRDWLFAHTKKPYHKRMRLDED